jgi:hypothetical protein
MQERGVYKLVGVSEEYCGMMGAGSPFFHSCLYLSDGIILSLLNIPRCKA